MKPEEDGAIREGMDAVLTCKHDANPPVYSVVWTHNVIFKQIVIKYLYLFRKFI